MMIRPADTFNRQHAMGGGLRAPLRVRLPQDVPLRAQGQRPEGRTLLERRPVRQAGDRLRVQGI